MPSPGGFDAQLGGCDTGQIEMANIAVAIAVVAVLWNMPCVWGLARTTPCLYDADNGVYMSTYGSLLQRTHVPPAAYTQLELALALPYIKGVAHYQNWSQLEMSEGVYNWSVVDRIIDAAGRFGKHVILGLQMGVCAPAWLLENAAVLGIQTVDFVHANPGWRKMGTMQRWEQGYLVSTMAVPWGGSAGDAANGAAGEVPPPSPYEGHVLRAVAAMSARYAHRPQLAYINVCGPSASGGVEANFFVNYPASRKVNKQFDVQLNFTLDNHCF